MVAVGVGIFFLMIGRPPRSTLVPYTSLFGSARSEGDDLRLARAGVGIGVRDIRTDVLAGEEIAGGRVELHLILHARSQAGDVVEAITAGGGSRAGVVTGG